MNDPLCLRDNRDKYYLAAVHAEIEIESRNTDMIPDYSDCIDIHPLVNAYLNSNVIGEPDPRETGWYELLSSNYSEKPFGLSLGTGSGRHQVALKNKGFVKRWESIDLVIKRGEFLKYGSAADIEMQNDLNFINLRENRYPLIFCNGVLHHIVNIEHLIWQVNKALTDDGIFIMVEYVGETKWQWRDKKIKVINDLLKKMIPAEFEGYKIKRPSIWYMNESRPLESVRSEALLPVINSVFGSCFDFQLNIFPALYPIINQHGSDLAILFKKDPGRFSQLIATFIEIDKFVIAAYPQILPCQHIGIYRKNKTPVVPKVRPWNNVEIRKNLDRKVPFLLKTFTRFKRLIKYTVRS
jgi:SAM-dependent methyltransferase